VLRAAQRADRTGDRGVHVGAGARDHAGREGRGVEFVLGVEDQRRVHRVDPLLRRLRLVQHVQEVPADRIVVGLDVDAPAAVAVVIPVREHRAEACDQPVGDLARGGDVVIVLFRQRAAERRDAAAHDVHRMTRGGELFQHRPHDRGQAAQPRQLRLVTGELGLVRQLLVDQQVRDLFELAARRDVQDVVAAVVKVVAGAAHRAQRSVAGCDTRQSHGLLRLEAWGWFAHRVLASRFAIDTRW
jgi:hypothetical protein